MKCPDRGYWRRYVDGELASFDKADAADHLAGCKECLGLVGDIEAETSFVKSALAVPGDSFAPEDALNTFHGSGATRKTGMSATTAQSSRKFFRPALVAGLAVLMVLSISLSPVRSLAGDFLGLFRLQQVETVTFDDSGDSMPDLSMLEAALGDFEFVAPSSEGTISEKRAAEILGAPMVVPDYLPGELERSPIFGVLPSKISLTFDSGKIKKYLDRLGVSQSLAASLDGETIKGTVPGYVHLEYAVPRAAAKNLNSSIVFIQGRVPFLEASSNDIDVDALWAAMLKLPVLPEDVRSQLSGFADWRHTLPVPVPAGEADSEKVKVGRGNYDGAYLTGKKDDFQALIWTVDDRLYAVIAPPKSYRAVSRAELFKVAASVQGEGE